MNEKNNHSNSSLAIGKFKKTPLALAVSSAFMMFGISAVHGDTVTVSAPQTTAVTSFNLTPTDVDAFSGDTVIGNFDIDGSAAGQIDNDDVIIGSAGSIITTSADHGVVLSVLSRAQQTKTVIKDNATSPAAVVWPDSSFDIEVSSQARVLNSSVTNDGQIRISRNTSDSVSGVRVEANAQEGSNDDGAALVITFESSRNVVASNANSAGTTDVDVIISNVSLRHNAEALVQDVVIDNNGTIAAENGSSGGSVYGLDLRADSESEVQLELTIMADVDAESDATTSSASGDATATNDFGLLITGAVADSSASIKDNVISNRGSITVEGDRSVVGIRTIAETESDVDINLIADANASAEANAGSGDTATASGDARVGVDGTLTSLRAIGESLNDNNSVTNAGTVTVTSSGSDATGVAFLAHSDIDADVILDARSIASEITGGSGSTTADADADSSVELDVTRITGESIAEVQNSTFDNRAGGRLIVSGTTDVVGLRLEALADVKIDLDNDESGGGTGETQEDNRLEIDEVEISASAVISNNLHLTNSGAIQVTGTSGDVAGVQLSADAETNLTLLDAVDVGDGDINVDDATLLAAASVYDNQFVNSGSIVVNGGSGSAAGIELLAHADQGRTDASGDFNIADVDGSGDRSSTATATISGNEITTSGLIAVDGGSSAEVDGIRLEATADAKSDSAFVSNNILVNTGRIYAMDDGIELSADDSDSDDSITGNTITNSYAGRIVARDIGITINDGGTADATNGVRGNVINNSGLIVSDNYNGGASPGVPMSLNGSVLTRSTPFGFNSGEADTNVGTAIRIEGAADSGNSNTVNLDAPSYIAGQFLFDRDSNVNVSLSSGVSHSVRWVFSDEDDTGHGAKSFVLDGPVPWFTNMGSLTSVDQAGINDIADDSNDIFATIDPSAFAAAPHMLADLTGMVSDLANHGLDRSVSEDRNGFWIAVRGVEMDYDGDGQATMDQSVRTRGVAVGYSRDFGETSRIGFMLGHGDQDLDVGSFYGDVYSRSYDNESDGIFIGLHGKGMVGDVELGLGISGGHLDHENRRFVNDNLQWWGLSYADSEYDSRWYAPEFSVAIPLAASETFTVKPIIYGRHMAQKFDSYTETGSNANATVHAHTTEWSEIRAGVDLIKQFDRGSITTRVGYLGRNNNGDENIRVTMIGDTNNVPVFAEDTGSAYAGLNLRFGGADSSVHFELDGTYISDGDMQGGNLGAKLNFKF